jgi:hypothetical protein
MKLFHAGFVICGLFALSPDLFAQFTYSTNGNVITLASYTGSGGNVTIPDFVTEIGVEAFSNPGTLTSVTIPSSVTTIDYEAFAGCGHLVGVTIYGSSITTIGDDAFVDDRLLSVYCTGNAPPNSPNGYNSFPVEFGATAYYLAGTSGWATFSANTAIQTVLWNPPVVANNGNPGTPGNPFGFTITGSTNLPVLVEASTNLADGTWIPVQSCIITNGSFYFTDPAWTNYPSRFYKVVLP